MQRRITVSVGLALLALGSAFIGSSATADNRAIGLEEVALVDVPAPTHFDWFTREVNETTHVIAMIGSRDATPKGAPNFGSTVVDGVAGGGLNLVDVTDPENPEFLVNVVCPTDNNDVAYIEADHWVVPAAPTQPATAQTPGAIRYDAFILMSSNDEGGCSIQNGPNKGAVSVIGVRATPAAGDVITVDWLRSPFRDLKTGAPFLWNRAPAAHTVVAHPNLPLAYVGNQVLADRDPSVEILDLSVWPPKGNSFLIGVPATDTRTIPTAAANGPHDITFSPSGDRAYASAINSSYVWDTSGAKVYAPETLSTLVSPNLKIHHETVLHPNGRHLLTVDEFVATSNENIPVCPGGAIHVFDTGPLLEDGTRAFERAPVPVGQFYADEIGTMVDYGVEVTPAPKVTLETSCTAHEFNIPDSGEWMPLGWFGAGVRILDLSALTDQAVVDSPVPTPIVIDEIGYFMTDRNDVWAAKQHPLLEGYVFATDTANGFRVLKRI